MEEEVSSRIVIEEWNGTASSKLSKTATITAHSSSLSIRTHGGRFNHLSRRILEAFVPEATNLLSLSQSQSHIHTFQIDDHDFLVILLSVLLNVKQPRI